MSHVFAWMILYKTESSKGHMRDAKAGKQYFMHHSGNRDITWQNPFNYIVKAIEPLKQFEKDGQTTPFQCNISQ